MSEDKVAVDSSRYLEVVIDRRLEGEDRSLDV